MLSEIVFAKGMTFLTIALGEKNLDDVKLEVYYEILKDMSDESFETSIKQVAKTRIYKGLPTPAEILKFDTTRKDVLVGTREQAKKMYNKFYSRCSLMLDYCRENRETIPSDRAFFEAQDYKTLANVNNKKIFSKQEAYVLYELGGGSWLCDIRFLANSKIATDKIENIIKRGKIMKYLNTSNAITDKRVSQMLQGVA